MAKILSHVWSVIRGSVGGITYFTGPTGQIIARQRTAPVQPVSIFKTFAKLALTAGNGEWIRLTAIQQQAWATYALTVMFAGATGSYTVPGRQLMIGAFQLLSYITQRGLAAPTILKVAPSNTGFLLLQAIAAVDPSGPSVTGVGISITADALEDSCCLVDIQGPFEKERHFWKGPWDTNNSQAVVIPSDTTVLVDFIGLVADKFYFFRVKAASSDTGPRLSQEAFLRAQAKVIGP